MPYSTPTSGNEGESPKGVEPNLLGSCPESEEEMWRWVNEKSVFDDSQPNWNLLDATNILMYFIIGKYLIIFIFGYLISEPNFLQFECNYFRKKAAVSKLISPGGSKLAHEPQDQNVLLGKLGDKRFEEEQVHRSK